MVGKRTIFGIFVLVLAYYLSQKISKVKIQGKIVQTDTGKVQGIISKSRDGRDFYEWLGIKYGTAERFGISHPVNPWSDIKDASEYGATCAQLDMILLESIMGEEDCLFLNIHVPVDIPDGKLLPVLFWIHGGYFAAGSSDMYRPDYFMDEDIVVVTINYRLGALGFLSTGADGIVRGNMGLKDQVLALQWTKRNIKNFGGDPSNLIVAGESAGGASSQFHLISPMTKGLMSKVISQSGSALNRWAIYEDPLGQAKEFAGSLHCPTQDSKVMVDCLKNVQLKRLIEAHRPGLELFHPKSKTFVPTIETIVDENTFLSEDPHTLLKTGKFERIPFLAGYNEGEGLIATHVFLKNETFRQHIQENWIDFLEAFIFLTNEEKIHAQKIRDFYFGKGGRIDDLNAFDQVTNIVTDRFFGGPVITGAQMQAAYAPVYFYYYTKNGPSLFNLLLMIEKKLPAVIEVPLNLIKTWFKTNILGQIQQHYGAAHADELAAMWYMPSLFHVDKDDPFYQFSKDMTKLWVDFAVDDSSMRFRNQDFPKLNSTEAFKVFEVNDMAAHKAPDDRIQEAIRFWNKLDKI